MKLFLLLALVSCASVPERTVVESQVSALSKDSTKYKVKVVSGDPSKDELKFEKYARWTEAALEEAGYTIDENAEVEVKLFYGIEDKTVSNTFTNSSTGKVDTWHNTYFTRSAQLRAYKGKKQIWNIEVTSVGSNNKLFSVYPLMMRAAVPYIGKSLDKEVTVEVERAPASTP